MGLQMLIRAFKNINKKKLGKKHKRSSYYLSEVYFFKGVTTNELKKILCMVIQNGINKIDIYVIKTRFDITTLPKVGFNGGSN